MRQNASHICHVADARPLQTASSQRHSRLSMTCVFLFLTSSRFDFHACIACILFIHLCSLHPVLSLCLVACLRDTFRNTIHSSSCPTMLSALSKVLQCMHCTLQTCPPAHRHHTGGRTCQVCCCRTDSERHVSRGRPRHDLVCPIK